MTQRFEQAGIVDGRSFLRTAICVFVALGVFVACPIGCSQSASAQSEVSESNSGNALPSVPQLLELNIEQLSTAQLETQLSDIDRQLETVATPSMRSGVGAIGYRSLGRASADHREWIQVEFSGEHSIDAIALVPVLWRDTRTGFRADGFPIEFRVLVGSADDSTGTVIAGFTKDDQLLPRVAPVVIHCNAQSVSWIRIEATVLSPRAWDGLHIFQLSEIAAFDGQENIALHAQVSVSSEAPWDVGPYNRACLVDGFVPYLMDAQPGEQSIAFVSEVGIGDDPVIDIDLGSEQLVNRIHLHSTELSDTAPQAEPTNFGIPSHLLVEGSTRPDFSDAQRLMELKLDSVFEVGPVLKRRFEAKRCRYIRFRVLEPFRNANHSNTSNSQIGFAEIEVFCQGRNVALGKPVTANFKPLSQARSLAAVTDGNNLYGQILPTRLWLKQLAERHDLERLRPHVSAELNDRYQQQGTYVSRLIAVVGALAAATVLAILIGWVSRQQAILKTRQRIAADVHDELGANVHAIGLLSDLASNAADSPERLKPLMQRMRELTERTGKAAVHCASMLETDMFDDLEPAMRRTSDRILADIEHQLMVIDDDALHLLKPQRRADLFLFYKECLTNILRHSEATSVETRLSASGREIELTIVDNGIGLAQTNGAAGSVPTSLKRRARLLGGRVSVCHPPAGGTQIGLRMQTKKRWFFPR